MPVAPTYPGVYIEEIPSGVRTITGVATSITAFVGRAYTGPDNEPVTINTWADYERTFGGLWEKSSMSFAVNDFYMNGGGQAIIVRLYNPLPADKTAAETAAKLEFRGDNTDDPPKGIYGKFTDAWGGIENPGDAETAKDVVTATDKEAAYILSSKSPYSAAGKAAAEFISSTILSELGKLMADVVADVEDEVTDAFDTATCLIGRLEAEDLIKKGVETYSLLDEAVEVAKKAAVPTTNSLLTVDNLRLKAAYKGSWGNNLEAKVEYADEDTRKKVVKRLKPLEDFKPLEEGDIFNLLIEDAKTGATETFLNLTVKDHARRVDRVLEKESNLVRMASDEPPESIPEENVADVSQGDDATDGDALEGANFTGTGMDANKQGLYALENADLFNLLCIPPFKDDVVEIGLLDDASQYCEKRRAFFILDAPSSWNTKKAAKVGIAKLTTKSKNAAIFFPRLRKANPLMDNQMQNFPACGAVAGVMARTDSRRGIWKAPAGIDATLNGVSALSVPLTDMENGELNPLGINCLRTKAAVGRIVWGARTLEGDDRIGSEWKYIPVRRLALYIEESLYRGTQWVVFEPNDEPLWSQIRLNIGAFMNNLFRQGAFQGITPKDAYFVKCSSETTTQNDINLGKVNILVGFAPLKPAEFVILKIQQMAGQIKA